MRVLITNNTLAGPAGTECYVRDLALGLLARGHQPIAFSTVLGDVARELRARTVPVISDLAQLSAAPDIIHGHHHIETMMALLHFGETPAIFVCHGWAPWEETPPAFPRIRRYVAVDDACRDRLQCEHGVQPEAVRVLLNAVDLQRFGPRDPLPARPQRAAVFDNRTSEGGALTAIRSACASRGIALDVFGTGTGQSMAAPETALGGYDVVFGKARCALEAMATGAAVVLVTGDHMGPCVTMAEVHALRRLNFGVRTMSRPITADAIGAELDRYDPGDAARVSAFIREDADLTRLIDEWTALYAEVTAESLASGPPDRAAEGRAAATYLRSVSDLFKAGLDVRRMLHELGVAHDAAARRLDVLTRERAECADREAAAERRNAALETPRRTWLGGMRDRVRRGR